MANLIGYLTGRTREVHRLGNQTIQSQLETWNGCVRTVLMADGSFYVEIGEKGRPNKRVYTGNCEPGKRTPEVREA